MKIIVDCNYMRALAEVVPVNDARTYFHGVHLPPDSKELVACDGSRVLIVPVKVEDPLFNGLNQFCEGMTFKIPTPPKKSDHYVTIETGRNPERYEEVVWSYYDRHGKVREQLISHIVSGKFPDYKTVVPDKFACDSLTSLGFNPVYIFDVYTALGFKSGVKLLMGESKKHVFQVDFGKNCDAKYYVMPMHI